jgi:hypothetical protein
MLVDILAVLGALLVVAGVAMVYVPAALVVAGVSAFGFAWLLSRGS